MNFSHIVAWSIPVTKKCEIEKTESLTTPDPTKYEVQPSQSKAPAWTIGKSKRLRKISCNPGPGMYDYKTLFPYGPKYTIGEKRTDEESTNGSITKSFKRKIDDRLPNPGPGHYNPQNLFQSTHFLIRSRSTDQIPSQLTKSWVPDVGKYNLRNDDSLNVPCHKFSREERTNLLHTGTTSSPGPTKYEITHDTFGSSGPKYTWSKTRRNSLIKKSTTPAPGQYEHTNYIGIEGAKLTFYKTKSSADLSITPGPGFYNINYMDQAAHPFLISKAKRKEPINEAQLKTPSPNQYNPNQTVNSKLSRVPEWRISKSEREPLYNTCKVPGPGHYALDKDFMPTGPKYTIATKYECKGKSKCITIIPEPGKYDVLNKHLPKEPIPIIGSEKRSEGKKDITPGPGTYDYKDSIATHGISFPGEKKLKPAKIPFSPGPAQYHIPCTFDHLNEYTRTKGSFDPSFKFI